MKVYVGIDSHTTNYTLATITKDAEKAWIEAALEEGMEINEPDSIEDYSGQFKLRIPKTLHRTLALHARK